MITCPGWHLWMHTASLRSFCLGKEECHCGSSPTTVTAVIFTQSTYCCPRPSHGLVCPNTLQLDGRTSSQPSVTELFWGMPAEWVPQALELGIRLGMWAPHSHGDQTSILWPPDSSISVCLRDLGTLRKPKGLSTRKLDTFVQKPAGISRGQPELFQHRESWVWLDLVGSCYSRSTAGLAPTEGGEEYPGVDTRTHYFCFRWDREG